MSTVRRYNKYQIEAQVSELAHKIDHEAAKRGGYVAHPHNDYIVFEPAEPDAEQTAYERETHRHRSPMDWVEDHAGLIVWPLAAALVVTVWVGAVGIGQGWWL